MDGPCPNGLLAENGFRLYGASVVIITEVFPTSPHERPAWKFDLARGKSSALHVSRPRPLEGEGETPALASPPQNLSWIKLDSPRACKFPLYYWLELALREVELRITLGVCRFRRLQIKSLNPLETVLGYEVRRAN
jgi:hypothetical protein